MILSNKSLPTQVSYQVRLDSKTDVPVLDYRFGNQIFVLCCLGILIGSLLAWEAFDKSPAEEDHKNRD